MTSAIGKAATKATTIVEVNALSKFSSWRTLFGAGAGHYGGGGGSGGARQ
jgi:hypothetical protein